MSLTDLETQPAQVASGGRRRRSRFERNPHIEKIPIGPTTRPEKRQLPDHPDGDHADQFSALWPEEVEKDTRNVRLDISFGEVIRIRDQAEMVIAAMREIMDLTKKHDLGSIQQRMHARHVAATLGRALMRFNGKTPYGEYRRKK